MVKGLQLFRDYFAEFKDRYVLIGGIATVLSLEDAGLQARATKDLDIVLCLETLDKGFTEALWKFVEEGSYEAQKGGDGKTRYYRFSKPQNASFPEILELFSREPDHFNLADDAMLTPIPVGEGAEDLSAILLDDDYYDFIHKGAAELVGVTCLRPSQLIPVKAHAWLNLTADWKAGKKVDQTDIKKHRKDIARLAQVMRPDDRIELPEQIHNHLREFIDQAEADEQFKPEDVTQGGMKRAELIELLRTVYVLVKAA
jgi:hypothetical protein